MNLYLEIYNWRTTKRKFIVPFIKRLFIDRYCICFSHIFEHIKLVNKYSYSEEIKLLLYSKFPYIGVKI